MGLGMVSGGLGVTFAANERDARMSLFLLKLTLTPMLIAMATLASRRWGPVVGGWMVGLPLTSGPISVFLVLEQGTEFAATAAANTLLGTMPMITFPVVYAWAARKLPWPAATLLALAMYFIFIAVLSLIALPLSAAAVTVLAYIALALFLEGPTAGAIVKIPAPWWDIPFRMLAATMVVLLITVLSTHLGPGLSGLLSTFPAFICVMSIFSHTLCGPASVRELARGMITGSFSFAAFFIVVSLSLGTMSPFLVYPLAMVTATIVNLPFLIRTARRNSGK